MNSEQIDAMVNEKNLAKTDKDLLIELLEATKKSNDLALTRNQLLDRIKNNVVFFAWLILGSFIASFLIFILSAFLQST